MALFLKKIRSFVNERLRLANQRVRELEDEKKWRELGLRRKLSSNDFEKVNNIINEHAEQVFQRTKKSQQAKFDRWSRQRAGLTEPPINEEDGSSVNREKWVINLSQHDLTDNQQKILQKGLNFAQAPRRIMKEEIIANVESTLRKCTAEPERLERARAAIANTVRNAKPPKFNITAGEHEALRSLRTNKDITILPADKGNATVILDSVEYEEKAANILDHPPFQRLEKDPTTKTEKRINDKLKQLVKQKKIGQPTANHLRVSEKGTRPPLFYGSAKIHKPNVPLRPIVSTVGSATYNLSRFVSNLLKPYAMHTDSYISNTKDFIEKLQDIEIADDEVMVSFDVKALFTSVPTDAAKVVISNLLENDSQLSERTNLTADTIMELVNLCIETTNFQFKGKHYRLLNGLAMGAPASPTIANVYMTKFEQDALQNFSGTKPKCWYRYVDDVFSIVKRACLKALLQHLNNQHPSIQFTLETEKEGALPFMDVTIHRQENRLQTTVYRKPTHSGRYLNYDSHHPPSAKRSVVQALFKRIDYITKDEEAKEEEIKRIRTDLTANGYKPEFIRQTMRKSAKQVRKTKIAENANTTDKTLAVTIPYVEDLSESIRRILAPLNIRTAYTTKKIKWSVMKGAKDTIPDTQHPGVVYALGCKDCAKVYVGETGCTAQRRAEQHRYDARTGRTELSAVAAHAHNEGHQIHWEPMVVKKESNLVKRKVLEALTIKKLGRKTINQDSGLKLSNIWLDLIQ